MTSHRYTYNRYKKTNKCFISSFILFDEYGIENCFIELLEAKHCNNIDEVKQLEGGYIRTLECVNKNIAGRTIKEYNKDNKESNKEHYAKYYEANKDDIQKRHNKYYEDNKEKIRLQQSIYKKEYYNKLREKKKELKLK